MKKTELSAVIADDETTLREYLKHQLQLTWPELKIIGEAENGIQALQLIKQLKPDIAFLDIKMPGLSGLDVAARVQGLCHIVFVTAYDEFAIKAFEMEAIDYLQKPVTKERLKSTVKRIQQRVNSAPDDLNKVLQLLQQKTTTKTYLNWIRASLKDEVHVIAVDDVLYFQSEDKYTTVVTHQREYIVRTSLKELESELDPDRFWRIHRATLVQVSQIDSSKKDFAGHMTVQMQGKSKPLSVSRSYQHLFRAE